MELVLARMAQDLALEIGMELDLALMVLDLALMEQDLALMEQDLALMV